jgi:ABC-type lipoprotein export system ATPase subunit
MSNLDKYTIKSKKKVMLTKYIEKNDVTLIYGKQGSGKKTFAICDLNINGIEPILMDFDNNYQNNLNKLNYKVERIDWIQ